MKKKIIISAAILSTSFAATVSASEYKVESGDSLWSISKKYHTSVTELKRLNNISSDLIYPNQVLKLSGSVADLPKPTQPESSKPSNGTKKTYTVRSGDTLSKIAIVHSISLKDLMTWNGISSHLIFPGQNLVVSNHSNSKQPAPAIPKPDAPPSNSESSDTYKIKTGDTLSGISLKFNTSVQEIKRLNSLSSDLIYAGQVLMVRDSGTSSPMPAPTPSIPAGDANKLVAQAKTHIGTPYVWGGSTTQGFDCSGFIYYVHNEIGKSVSRYSSEGYYNRSYYIHSPKPGDLVFFENTYKKGISHLGIYIGNNQFIHAGDNGVEITSLSNSYWKSKFDGFKRFY
jgi:peptidoglycan DL-endopeptidase LytE